MAVAETNREPLSHFDLWLNLVVISGTWGSSFLFVKLISQSMPPFAFSALRGFIAMAALLAWVFVRTNAADETDWRAELTDWRNLQHVAVLGTTNGWLAHVLIFVAVSHVDTAIVAMIQAAVPLIVAIMAHFLFAEERFHLGQLAGILVGAAGILLIIGPVAVYGGRGSILGVGAILLAAVSYAWGTVYGRRVATTNGAALACGQYAFGAVVAAAISVFVESPALASQPARIWVLLAIVGIVSSAVPTALYLRLLGLTRSVPAAFVAYLQPVWAALLGWTILGEEVRTAALLGTGLVIAGIVMSTRRTAD